MGISIPKLLAQHLGKQTALGFVSATLHAITPGVRTVGAPASGTNPATTTHACKGMVESYELRHIDGTIVMVDDRRVSLLGASIAGGVVPKAGHKITIKGVTYRVISVGGDSVDAMFVCQCRKA